MGEGDEHHLGREKSTADKEGEMEDNEPKDRQGSK